MLARLAEREKTGTRRRPRQALAPPPRRFYALSRVLKMEDRHRVILLGFSRDGEHLFGYMTDLSCLLLWPVTLANELRITARPPPRPIALPAPTAAAAALSAAQSRAAALLPTPPCMSLPLPRAPSSSEVEADSASGSLDLSVTQSADCRLVALLGSSFPPPSDGSERNVAIVLCPVYCR